MELQPPQPDEVKALRERHGLKQADLAKLLHSSVRTVQHWEALPGTTEYRQMPLASWELALLKLDEHALDRTASTKAKVRRKRTRTPSVPKPPKDLSQGIGGTLEKPVNSTLAAIRERLSKGEITIPGAKAPETEIERLRRLAKETIG